MNGAGERNRTPDRLITNQLLYRLSYASNDLCRLRILLNSHPGRNSPAVLRLNVDPGHF